MCARVCHNNQSSETRGRLGGGGVGLLLYGNKIKKNQQTKYMV